MAKKVRLTEKHVEDWICANPQEFMQNDTARLAARQDRLLKRYWCDVVISAVPPGRGRRELYIIEVKKGPVTERTVAQVLRYRGAMLEMARGRIEDFSDRLHCIAVGSDVKPEADLAARGAGVVRCVTYEEARVLNG